MYHVLCLEIIILLHAWLDVTMEFEKYRIYDSKYTKQADLPKKVRWWFQNIVS